MGRAAIAAPLEGLRAAVGRRNVNWTPEFMGFGNHLYLWCWAHSGPADRQHRVVLMTEKMRYWAQHVPDFARDRIVERGDVSFLDRRGHYWAENETYTGDPRGFTQESRDAFVTEVLLPSPLLQGVRDTPYANDDVIVINVRRGDYYSDPFHRPRHAMDVVGYLREAVPRSIEHDGPVERLHLVSDDIGWCVDHLSWLESYGRLTHQSPDATPASSFRDLCSARRLVMTNSTFSMWAAFVSTALYGDNLAKIWAPAFFMSTYAPGRCYEYDSGWSFVDDLPGGWQPEWLLSGTAPSGAPAGADPEPGR